MAELHVTIGPVQGFIAQSRRTRDLWASSWILSYLAGKAMEAVLEVGTLVLPRVSRAELAKLLPSEHATLPNRFVAEVDDPTAAANAATAAIDAAWKKIATTVYGQLVAPAASLGQDTKAIWDRQVSNFWDVTWVVGHEQHALDLRKNWRNGTATVEGGDHCTMMGDWQELSGHFRSTNRSKQDQFWDSIRRNVGELDLAEDERLCAPSLIKRMFGKPQIHQTALPGIRLEASNWPSTYWIAAAPWIAKVCSSDDPEVRKAAGAYAQLCATSAHGGALAEKARLPMIRDPYKRHRDELGKFPMLDGNFFNAAALADEKSTPLKESATRDLLVDRLRKLYCCVDDQPSPFYAMLLMDGDGLGKLLRAAQESQGAAGVEAVTTSLVNFAAAVPDVVEANNGITIYAGGDDVLAMVTLPDALACARALEQTYRDAFADHAALRDRATISAAIVYAHHQTPFSQVLGEAHRLLDDVAKEKTGRASLAVSVWKASGRAIEFAAPWVSETVEQLDKLQAIFASSDVASDDGPISGSFLYALRQRFSLLTGIEAPAPGDVGEFAEGIDAGALLLAEYLVGKGVTGERGEQVKEEGRAAIEKLLIGSRRPTRDEDGNLRPNEQTFALDGPMFARFIAGGGKEIER